MASGHEVVLDDAAQEVTVKHGLGCVIRLDRDRRRDPGERVAWR